MIISHFWEYISIQEMALFFVQWKQIVQLRGIGYNMDNNAKRRWRG